MGFIRKSENQKVKNAVKVVDGLRDGPRRVDRASKDIETRLNHGELDALQLTSVLVKIEERIKNEPIPTTHLTTEVIDVASKGNDVMGLYTKLVNNDDDDENKFSIEKSTIAENFYDRTHCNSNYETYVNCKDFTSDFFVRGDYTYKGKTIGDYSFENCTIGNYDYISITEGNVTHLYETKGNLKKEYKRGKDFDYSLNVTDNYKDILLVGGDYEKRSEIECNETIVCDVKGSVVENLNRGVDLTENLTVGQNFLENTDITGNRSIYWKTGGKMIREHTISGDRDILCDVKGSVVENLNRGVDLTENLTVGKDYVRDEKIDANKTVNNTINGSLNNKTIVRETETSFKRVNGSQTIKVVVDEYDEVLVIRNGKKKGGPKKGYYKYKNVKIGDEELLVLCRCNAECKK